MDDVRADERYTTSDVIRATEPVVAPVTPETPITDTTTTPGYTSTRDTRVISAEPAAEPVGYERRVDTVREPPRRGFSLLDSFLGWNIAAFWMLVLTGIVLYALGTSAYNTTNGGANTGALNLGNFALAGIAGLILAQFVAYFIGGFGAGRMARGSGVANGLGVAIWGVVVAVLLGALVYALGTQYDLGYWANFYGLNFGNWTGQVWATVIGLLVAMFLGGILGGMVGARPWERRYGTVEERRGVYRRGRPL